MSEGSEPAFAHPQNDGGVTLVPIRHIAWDLPAAQTPELIETILTHLAARETGGIHHPRAPPLHAPLTQPPGSPSPALS